MMTHSTWIRPACKARSWLVPVIAAVLALGAAQRAGAESDAHALMEGRGRDVSFPVACGAEIQPRYDAALAALHSFWYGQALKEFTAIIADDGTNIRSVDTKPTPEGTMVVDFVVETVDVRHLNKLVQNLRKVPGVRDVQRVQKI